MRTPVKGSAPRRARAASPSRRGLRVVVPAAAASLVLLVGLALPGAAQAAPAAAAAPVAQVAAAATTTGTPLTQSWTDDSHSPGDLGQAAVGTWVPSAGATSATAQLPGGVGAVRLDGAPADLVSSVMTGQFPDGNPVSVARTITSGALSVDPRDASCLRDALAPPAPRPDTGFTVACGTKTVTVTFERPVADPVLWFNSTVITSGGPIVGPEIPICEATWHDSKVTTVDGAPASTRAISLASSAFTVASYLDGAFTHHWPVDAAGGCGSVLPNPRGYPGVRIEGVVSTVTIDLQHIVEITRMTTSDPLVIQDTVQPSFALTVSADIVDLQAEVTAPATVAPGGTFEWTVDVRNLSTIGSHGFVLSGAVPESVTGASIVDAPEGCVLTGRDLSCAGAPEGWTVEQNQTIPTLADLAGADPRTVGTVLDGGAVYGPITLRGTAPTTPGTELVTTAAVSGVDSDLDLANNSARAVTTVDAPVWTVSKTVASSGDSSYPAPGDTLTYTVTATSTYGDVTDVVLTDDLTDVLTDADLVAGSPRYTLPDVPPVRVLDPTRSDPVLVAGLFTLKAGTTVTLTYSVVVHEGAWSATLANTVVADGSGAPDTCATGAAETDPTCSTSTVTTARVGLHKQGMVNGVLVALDGAAFEVLADESGTPGEVLATPVATPVAGQRGAFEVARIDPGTYWLRESTAPVGHELLATAIRFAVAEDGVVTILDGGSPQVIASGGTITVTDTPTFEMPETGSTGTDTLRTAGLVVLAAAVLLLRFSNLRTFLTTTSAPHSGRRSGS